MRTDSGGIYVTLSSTSYSNHTNATTTNTTITTTITTPVAIGMRTDSGGLYVTLSCTADPQIIRGTIRRRVIVFAPRAGRSLFI